MAANQTKRGGGVGRVGSGGEDPIKGDCARQFRVTQAEERVQGDGLSPELNLLCLCCYRAVPLLTIGLTLCNRYGTFGHP